MPARATFVKLGARKYLVISIVMAAGLIEWHDGRVASARIAIGACAPTALRLPKLEALSARLSAQYGIKAVALQADLEASDGARQLHAAVKARGLDIHTLVNNAGYGLFGEFKDTGLDDELRVKRAIRPVTGASLTVAATTDAVRRVLALHQVLGEPQPRR